MPCQIPPPTAPMAKAPPKSLRITHGLRIWAVISIHVEMAHTHGLTRDPVYDLHVPWERREGKRRVYITVVGVLEERVDRGERNLFLRGGRCTRDVHVAAGHDRFALNGT